MKLSIVIPAYNEEESLPKVLASLAKQTFQDYEIIVADAFSKDKTREIAQNHGAKVIDGGMPGPGRNRGVQVAEGELILFLDADTELPNKDFLKDCVEEFEREGLDIGTCHLVARSERKTDKFFAWFYNNYIKITRPILPHAAGFCIFARRELHHKLNGFDETVVFAEDMDYAQRATKGGAKFRYLKSQKIPMDTRRFDRDGRVTTAVRFTLAELYMIFIGSIKTDIFRYRFGHAKKVDAKKESEEIK